MSDILICYFSVTQTTHEVAKRIQKITNGDLFEIVPKEKYSPLDIDYDNKRSRTSIEDLNPDLDVAIASKVENFDQYKYIFLGFPIWWLREPNIIRTFLKSYDFSQKTIIPFCTSSSSGFGSSQKTIQELAKPYDCVPGKRISSYETDASLQWWIKSSLEMKKV